LFLLLFKNNKYYLKVAESEQKKPPNWVTLLGDYYKKEKFRISIK